MASQHHIVGKDDALADSTIVRNMGVGQKNRARAHDRFGAAARGTGIHRYAFSNGAILTDHKADWFAAIFEVLRWMPDRSKGINDRASTDRGVAGQSDM